MSEQNKFLTYEGLQDYDKLIKEYMPVKPDNHGMPRVNDLYIGNSLALLSILNISASDEDFIFNSNDGSFSVNAPSVSVTAPSIVVDSSTKDETVPKIEITPTGINASGKTITASIFKGDLEGTAKKATSVDNGYYKRRIYTGSASTREHIQTSISKDSYWEFNSSHQITEADRFIFTFFINAYQGDDFPGRFYFQTNPINPYLSSEYREKGYKLDYIFPFHVYFFNNTSVLKIEDLIYIRNIGYNSFAAQRTLSPSQNNGYLYLDSIDLVS